MCKIDTFFSFYFALIDWCKCGETQSTIDTNFGVTWNLVLQVRKEALEIYYMPAWFWAFRTWLIKSHIHNQGITKKDTYIYGHPVPHCLLPLKWLRNSWTLRQEKKGDAQLMLQISIVVRKFRALKDPINWWLLA